MAPPEIAEALKRHEHTVHDASELPDPQEDILLAAGKKQWDIITTDAALARKPFEKSARFSRCIVFLQNSDAGGVDRLFERFKRLSPGRLYTVTGSRVKVRQLPGHL